MALVFLFCAESCIGRKRPVNELKERWNLHSEWSSYTEHIDCASDEISAGLVGKDQPFTVKVDGDTFTQTGTLSNGKGLSETWKRVN